MMRRLMPAAVLAAVMGTFVLFSQADASEAVPDKADAMFRGTGTDLARPDTPSNAKNAKEARQMGIAWLKKVQAKDGGWGAGNFSDRSAGVASDVATTAFVTLALHRDDPKGNAAQIAKGTEFVVNAIETAPDGPMLNTPRGTQPQGKLGQMIDTHLAARLLGEVIGDLPADLNKRANIAYDKVLTKVQKAQNADGSFDKDGWAPVLSTAIAKESLEQAAAQGRDVDEDVLAAADRYDQSIVQGDSFDASAGAGVQLYAVGSAMRSTSRTAEREKGKGNKAEAKRAEEKNAAAVQAVATDSGALMAGFGSAGGEEMLSYLMISDTLAEQGGKEWSEWEARVGDYLMGTQNADGSWAGHHCITSPVFVTAGALMTLTSGDVAARKRTDGSREG